MNEITAPTLGQGAPAAAEPPRVMVYTRDGDSEGVIRQALSDLGVPDAVFRSAGAGAAAADLAEKPSPRLLVADVSDVGDPVATVNQLVGVCEPSTAIVLIGDSNDIRLYRALKEAGAAEYFFKPLVTALVARTCNALLSGGAVSAADESRLGKLILVMGVRGGSGATTVAVRTARGLSERPPRPVVLVDLDLQTGDAALQLDAQPNHALCEALERAERVDELFLERGITEVTKHLDLLASLEPLEAVLSVAEDAVLSLLDILRRRYRYVVVEIPVDRAAALPRVLRLPSLLIVVSDSNLASARDVGRLRRMLGPNSAERSALHILNKSGAPGALSPEEFARGSGQTPDVVVPWSKEIAVAAGLGAKLKPECPALERALAPVFARVAGERVETSRSLLSKLLG